MTTHETGTSTSTSSLMMARQGGHAQDASLAAPAPALPQALLAPGHSTPAALAAGTRSGESQGPALV